MMKKLPDSDMFANLRFLGSHLEDYCSRRELSPSAMANLVLNESGFKVDSTTITKMQSGDESVPIVAWIAVLTVTGLWHRVVNAAEHGLPLDMFDDQRIEDSFSSIMGSFNTECDQLNRELDVQ